MLIERYRVDQDRAFAVLKRCSQDGNRRLAVVAQELIDTRKLPPVTLDLYGYAAFVFGIRALAARESLFVEEVARRQDAYRVSDLG
ncbi:ANTAR domain-containing protein [Kribbella orskensis]|uniref:ANTAR domain-containing protein n=1 Tax=Kribbella orskensis TaxID=2512216 RepID=A0ABY2BA56_9ACTN|nr:MULTISPECIES: ANTAR domain-containing protein [Kribbella]TCN32859.1 ANTAR domain-containing protein [Kribbella sp. VKM Ac-2500]TCO13267.1 ANTAR domain-containing protein [Kribbella orskensis]